MCDLSMKAAPLRTPQKIDDTLVANRDSLHLIIGVIYFQDTLPREGHYEAVSSLQRKSGKKIGCCNLSA